MQLFAVRGADVHRLDIARYTRPLSHLLRPRTLPFVDNDLWLALECSLMAESKQAGKLVGWIY